jgi:hypothetical protein
MTGRLPLLALLATAACAASSDEEIGAAGSAANEAAVFTETTDRAIKLQQCGDGATKGCYTNYAVTADIDGDGELDLVMANGGGHFLPTEAQPQVLMFGNGDGTFEDATATLGAQASIVRQLAVADFDGDGRLDIYMPGGFGQHADQLFMQKAKRTFANEIERIAGPNRSTAGSVHAGDIDNDGDIDIVVGDWGASPNPDADGTTPHRIRILENDGTGRFTEKVVLEAPGGTTTTDVDLQDVNGDFALDIVLTARNGQSRLYLNDGAGTFTDATESRAFPPKQGPFTFNAELCDVDSDGDLDLLFDGGGNFLRGHATQILINDGSGKYTDETQTRIVGEPSSDDNQVKCADVDNDGDYDLIVASLGHPMEKLLLNKDGKGNFELVDKVTPALGDPTLSLDVGDFDHDGKVDLFTAQGEVLGQPWLERIFKNGTANADKNKPIFRAVEKPKAAAGKPTIFRFAVTDAHTSETGQHVKNVTVDVGGVPIPAKFVGGDLYRAEIPPQRGAFKAIPKATDRAGNSAVGQAVDIAVE